MARVRLTMSAKPAVETPVPKSVNDLCNYCNERKIGMYGQGVHDARQRARTKRPPQRLNNLRNLTSLTACH